MSQKPAADRAQQTVLVVDDTPATLGMIAKFLEENGLQVVVAEEGEEAIRRARIVRPDLVLLDVMMPGLNGFETCRRLKEDESTHEIPVIFMTALTDTESKVAGFEVGGVDFVTKPIQLGEVHARVRNHLALHALQRELAAQNVERKQAEDEVRRLNAELERRVQERTAELAQTNRMFKILVHCNEAMVRATEEPELLCEICRILVELGDYPLAWVGFAEQNEARSVRPVARKGSQEGFLDGVTLSWADTETGQGATGRAIRTGQPCIIQDIQTDPGYAPCREETMRHGFRSAIALPLGGNGKAFGVLCIYATQINAFNPQEVELLVELAGDLAYGVRSLRTQAARTQAEAALRKSEERYRALYVDNPSMYFTVEGTGKVLSVNPFGAEQLGYTVAELVGRPVLDVFHPDDREEVSGQLAACMQTPNRIVHWEFRKVRKDGSILWVREAARAVHGGNESPIVLIVCEDVTVRKQAEERLQELSEFNESIIQNMAEGLIVVDGQGCITFVNPAQATLMGYGPGELIGRPWNTLVLPDQEAVIRGMEEAAGHIRTGRYELELARRDGTRVSVIASISLHSSGHGSSGYLIVFTDLSERKQLEGQLLQAQKMEAVGRLAGGVAHDFNNMLTAIVGFSDLLMSGFQLDDPRRDDVQEIRKAAERAGALTRQLLAFSRRQVLQPQVLDLNGTIANLEKMLRRLIGEDIEVQTVLASPLECVCADPGQIEQVLLNLVVNARDAMPQGGTLRIETSSVTQDSNHLREHVGVAAGAYVMLAVSDAGVGMDDETLSHLFEPFFTTKGAGKGTGLGLSTVYGIVKQSGGHIAVESHLRQGTTFRIYLPAVKQDVQSSRPSPAVKETASGSETILLVEDEEAVRTMAGRVLRSSGYSVLEARAGAEALALVEQHPEPIHLLLTDVVLPGGMNGWDLRERLLSLRPEIKALCMSGYAYDATLHINISERGIPFLEKPFKPAVLAQKVREVLEKPSTA